MYAKDEAGDDGDGEEDAGDPRPRMHSLSSGNRRGIDCLLLRGEERAEDGEKVQQQQEREREKDDVVSIPSEALR